jgi:hypothetical protein
MHLAAIPATWSLDTASIASPPRRAPRPRANRTRPLPNTCQGAERISGLCKRSEPCTENLRLSDAERCLIRVIANLANIPTPNGRLANLEKIAERAAVHTPDRFVDKTTAKKDLLLILVSAPIIC